MSTSITTTNPTIQGNTLDPTSSDEKGDMPPALDVPILDGGVAEIAALLVRSFRADRKLARESSDLAELERLHEGELRVAELHNKADEIRREGWTRGLAQIGSAACNVTGGVFALDAKTPLAGEATLSIGSGGGKGFEALGMILGNDYQAKAVNSQAQADLHDSRAEANRTIRDKFNDEANDAKQMATKIMEFVKEMNDTRNATLQIAASLKA